MNKRIVITALFLICTAIIAGAFGAHGLKKMVNEEGLMIFDKAVKYQMYSGLGFLAIGLASDKFKFSLNWFYNLGIIGVLIFCGLLYALTFKEFEPAVRDVIRSLEGASTMPFLAPDINGVETFLGDFKGQIVFIYFFT